MEHTVGPVYFSQGRQCAFLSFQASLPEFSKPGSIMETVQKLFMVAGDRLGPRGEGIQV